jgi:heme-degrading monooxygenase HmoA
MIVRIVQMTFFEDKIQDFTALFEDRKSKIRNFEGCVHLELWQDTTDPRIFFTYSIWNSEHDLNHYRFSEFFKDTWGKTKLLFQDKPQAWSVERKVVAD